MKKSILLICLLALVPLFSQVVVEVKDETTIPYAPLKFSGAVECSEEKENGFHWIVKEGTIKGVNVSGRELMAVGISIKVTCAHGGSYGGVEIHDHFFKLHGIGDSLAIPVGARKVNEGITMPTDTRVAEGLPWLVMTYVDMDWDWLVRNAKLRDRQNRLGFAFLWPGELAESKNDSGRVQKLRQCLEVLERVRLAREDTFCHDSITQAERAWLREHRSTVAAHWHLLTDMKRQDLPYASQW